MKSLIKNFALTAFIVCGISAFSFSQITKSDVESMLTQQGTTLAAVKKAHLYNVKTFYTDGSYKFTYEVYEDLKYSLTESGVVIQGKSVQLFPYSSIKHIMVSEASIYIHLL